MSFVDEPSSAPLSLYKHYEVAFAVELQKGGLGAPRPSTRTASSIDRFMPPPPLPSYACWCTRGVSLKGDSASLLWLLWIFSLPHRRWRAEADEWRPSALNVVT